MRKIRIYVDTSVFGGVGDDEFAEATRRFLIRLKTAGVTVVVSTELLRELGSAPAAVRREFDDIPDELLESISVDAEVEALADAYVAAGVLGKASRSDAIHVAAATVAAADLIVSWNFRHIVNFDRIRKYNAVNVLHGYRAIEIRSPAEVAYGDETQAV
jgi:predicted nucleic acid-binding protein